MILFKGFKAICSLYLVISWLSCFAGLSHAAETKEFQTFQGAWFKINYPANFTVKPSLKSATAVQGYDSVFFISPDKSVEFYIFSPQWNGTPSDIQINPGMEIIDSQDNKISNSKVTTRTVIKAKDGSYFRSIFDVEDKSLNTRQVFGFKFKNQEAYEKYKEDIQTFKKSLTQLGD
jgi:hypothetical protein